MNIFEDNGFIAVFMDVARYCWCSEACERSVRPTDKASEDECRVRRVQTAGGLEEYCTPGVRGTAREMYLEILTI